MPINLDRELTREWLLTNGRGGFASGTPVGVNTRRYHGLLCAAAKPPLERWMLLSNVLEKITIRRDEPALPSVAAKQDTIIELASFQFDGSIHPHGHEYLTQFEVNNSAPEPWALFVYETQGLRVAKRIILPRDRDEVRIEYEVAALPDARVTFELLPLVSMRDFHHLTQRFDDGFPVDTCKAAAIVHAWRGGPRLWMSGRVGGAGVPPAASGIGSSSAPATSSRPGGQDARPPTGVNPSEVMRFDHKPDWWRGFFYKEEAHRGQDCREDLFAPGWFKTTDIGGQDARPPTGGAFSVLFTARALFDPAMTEEGDSAGEGAKQLEHEAHLSRRSEAETEARVSSVRSANRSLSNAQVEPPSSIRNPQFAIRNVDQRLLDAADAFVVARRRADGSNSKTIVAGYHWFGDWGRDTFIAMPGLLFETKRFDEAFEILETFAAVQRNGLIPNRFSDYGDGCDYNSVDASMWFLHAATLYYQLTRNKAHWAQTLYPACRSIVEHFTKGTDFDIYVDTDGLVSAGNPATQLTWMDAKFGDTVFTPRHGKAVEINALWYHGLRSLEKLCLDISPQHTGHYDELADKAEASFLATFWNQNGNYLFDVVHGGRSPASRMADPAIRPNQIFAVSLPHTPLSAMQQENVLGCVRQHLLTPYGLRSLSPSDKAYRPHYRGTPFERDSAYHQGTVWGWLIGPYVEAHLRVHEFSPQAKAEMREHLQPLIAHLDEAGIGSVSEVFDGDPPHKPGGCIAQAWSVSELLRAWRLSSPD